MIYYDDNRKSFAHRMSALRSHTWLHKTEVTMKCKEKQNKL